MKKSVAGERKIKPAPQKPGRSPLITAWIEEVIVPALANKYFAEHLTKERGDA